MPKQKREKNETGRILKYLQKAQVAQLVEHVTENHGVGGSIPPLGTITQIFLANSKSYGFRGSPSEFFGEVSFARRTRRSPALRASLRRRADCV
jgi:hypothetical protein